MAEKKLYDRLEIKVDAQTKRRLERAAEEEGVSLSFLVRTVLAEWLQKDVVWQGQMQAGMEFLRGQVERLHRDMNLFSDLWLYWVEFYFAYTKSFGDMDDRQKKFLIHEGKKRAEMMVESFKSFMKEKRPGLVEKLVADYIVREER